MRADVSAPVEVAADNLSVDQADGSALFSGNVVIGQGEMRLSADEVTVDYAEGGQERIRSLTAIGNVTLVSGEDAAEAGQAVYDVAGGSVVLTGDVLLTQGGNVLQGDRVTVDLATGSAQVQGRVRSVLQPGTE
ncbi:lipopolysaccharide transport periplasmic protein LptA [Paracoccus liaowanqingii]|nr:lipopolysaccharide transport periplasmic protein LptA [Paracoccus liaowanqingii]